MNLSKQAKKDLLKVLQKEMGLEASKDLSDEDLNKIGSLLLTVLAENLKMRRSESQV
jgi:hypothetical protein